MLGIFGLFLSFLGFASHFAVKALTRRYAAAPAKMTGEDAAKEILRQNSLERIKVGQEGKGFEGSYIFDDEEIWLGERAFEEKSVSSVAVSSHECGHALQRAENGFLSGARRSLFWVSRVCYIGILPAFAIGFWTAAPIWAPIGKACFAGILCYHLSDLPVEWDASRRALREIRRLELLEEEQARKAGTLLALMFGTYATAFALMVFLFDAALRA